MLDSASHNGLSDPKWLEENAKPDATDVVGDTGNPLSTDVAKGAREGVAYPLCADEVIE
jgi:hypothetical protein